MLNSSTSANLSGSNEQKFYRYKRYVIVLIAVGAVVRLTAAAKLELGNDEAYYWLYSQYLQWNYFDHPPMTALWIRLFTFNLNFENELFVRLGSVFSCALSTWFIFKTASSAFSEKAGWYTACLFNGSFYVSVTAGVYILPDSPQIVFWTFCMYMLSRIVQDEKKWQNWILFGAGCGLCLMSKVHGVFIWAGFILFIIFMKRKWLTEPRLYISMLITALIFLPVLVWNIRNDFITYSFHSNRVSLFSTDWNKNTFFREILSQVFLNNPVNVILIFMALYSISFRNSVAVIFKFIGIPLALLLVFISLTRETLGHWSGPAYVTLLPLAGRLVEEKYKRTFPLPLKLSLGVFIIGISAGLWLQNYYPGTWGDQNSENLGRQDYSLDMYGWKKAGNEFSGFYREQSGQGKISGKTPMVCTYWTGAHVEYYFAKPNGLVMIGLGPVGQLHQYHWTNTYRMEKIKLDTALCVISSIHGWPTIRSYRKFYNNAELIKEITISRNHKPAHNFKVYRLTGRIN